METINKKDKRKQLLIIPLFIIPFLALTFYAMGGGKGRDANLQTGRQEINAELPDAAFKKEEPTNKMGFYKQSEIDSAHLIGDSSLNAINARLTGSRDEQDIKTDAINQKLEALKKELNQPDEPIKIPNSNQTSTNRETSIKNDVDRLEALMKTMQSGKEDDPEMQQLSGMMDKIIAIQNPELARQKFQQTIILDSQFRATPAIIVDNQKAVQGATVKIRLQDTLRIAGILVPKGHELFGACRITNQRLLLDIKNIRLGTSIIPVDLSIYSLDGMIGIDAPEAMLTGALNNGTDDAVRSVGFGGFDQTVATQVAGAGIDAARQLISKKVKSIKVKLKSGHAILLRNNQLRSR
ncbi:MAG: conjugative transposon protein TraM [Sphingobacteriales bacterium]|nr:MAG: conjugative transposon protein TraM [Sphingobacteriales bacterium]